MQIEQIFQVINAFAIAGWVILIFLPFWQASDKLVIGIMISLFAIVYTWLIFSEFIKKKTARHQISYWLVIPCLFFTFMLGPFGLLPYLVVRLLKTKKYFVQNF